MGSFVNTLFSLLLGWFRAAVSTVWSVLTKPEENLFWSWFSNHWMTLAVILCIAGMAGDFIVYLLRWQPYKVWRSFFRRLVHREVYSPEAVVQAISAVTVNSVTDHDTPEPPASHAEPEEFHEQPDKEEIAPEHIVSAAEKQPVAKRRRRSEAFRDIHESSEVEQYLTRSGYVVPADSPYRRPMSESAPESEPAFSRTEQSEKNLLMNRRRIRISDFFSDQAEDFHHTREPQELIDANEAYYKPVYPKRWREPEDTDE